MTTYIYDDPYATIHATVIEDADAMREYLDIYRNPNTRFHARIWSGECMLTPLALAVEFAGQALDFATILSVFVNIAGINPNEPYVIDDFTGRLSIRTNALTHLLALWKKDEGRFVSS